jgi:hypothetical protein
LLVHYFKREANALDVGMIASNDRSAAATPAFAPTTSTASPGRT